MLRSNLPVLILLLTLLISLSLGLLLGYKLYQAGKADFFVFEKIAVFSEVPNIKAEINNKEELDSLIYRLNFWEGVTPDNFSGQRNSFRPKKLIIHITEGEYTETRFSDVKGDYFSSYKTQGNDRVFHLYLGFKPGWVEAHLENSGRAIDINIIEALYEKTRLIKGTVGQELITLRDNKLEQSYVKLTK